MSPAGGLAVPLCSPRNHWLALDRALSVLFQTTCLICEGPAADGRFCLNGHWLVGVPDTCCGWCGEILSQRSQQCGRCRGGQNYPLPSRSLFRLNEDARLLLHRLKFDGYAGLFDLLVPSLESWQPWEDAEDFVLVPVPLHPRRFWKRGFNLSEKIAAVLGDTWGLPVYPGLVKQKENATQASLNRDERQQNLKGSFLWKPRSGVGKVLLVDDVFTTGATFLACAEALKGHKIKEVRTASAFRTPLFKTL